MTSFPPYCTCYHCYHRMVNCSITNCHCYLVGSRHKEPLNMRHRMRSGMAELAAAQTSQHHQGMEFYTHVLCGYMDIASWHREFHTTYATNWSVILNASKTLTRQSIWKITPPHRLTSHFSISLLKLSPDISKSSKFWAPVWSDNTRYKFFLNN